MKRARTIFETEYLFKLNVCFKKTKTIRNSDTLQTLLLFPDLFVLISVFLKLKWYRSMKFYLFYVLLYVLFAFSLGGFLLTHLGHVYHGAPEYEYQVNIHPEIFVYDKISNLEVESLPSFCA